MGGAELIDSTYQLIGKFLMFKNRDKTNVQNCQDFFLWLKAKGLTSHVNDIVEAVAEKVKLHMMFVHSERMICTFRCQGKLLS